MQITSVAAVYLRRLLSESYVIYLCGSPGLLDYSYTFILSTGVRQAQNFKPLSSQEND